MYIAFPSQKFMIDIDTPDSQIYVLVHEKSSTRHILLLLVCCFQLILTKSVSILSQGESRKWKVEIIPMSWTILGNTLADLCVPLPASWVANITGNIAWFPRKVTQKWACLSHTTFFLIFLAKCFTPCVIAKALPQDSVTKFICFIQSTYRLVWFRKLIKSWSSKAQK